MRPPTSHTALHNAAASVGLDRLDPDDFERARRGLLAQIPDGKIDGTWDLSRYAFLDSDEPDPAVHPSLWRQSRLNAVHGLFEVAPGCWQARGYDISNITFIEGATGRIVIDPLTATACARDCLALANAQLGGGGSYFHAITAGNNSVPGVTGFSASASSPGYNLATGLGTVNGANFVQGYTDLLPTSQTSLTLGSSSVVSGQTVTLTATVSGAGSTGSVQFLDNGAPLDGLRPLSGGQATLTTSALQVGVHSIVARFSGTASLRSSSSTPAALTVQAVASVAVSATPASLRAGEVIALQASVSGNNPSGWVQFTDGGSPLGAPVALSNGVASWSGNALRRSGTSVLAYVSLSEVFRDGAPAGVLPVS